jgi:hypothetical protein
VSAIGFKKAAKTQARARVAISGPAGSGKTYTALLWAQALGQRVAVIDTERGSASLYADLFDFDVLDLTPPYHPQRLIDCLNLAAEAGYDVTVIDSGSHFWAGEGGVLEIVDAAKSGSDSYRAWSKGTPLQQRMVDAILRHPSHVIYTMRSKMEYALVDGDKGKKTVQKIGLAPVQRDGIEYEFTVMMDVDMRHVAHVTKSRYSGLADADITPEGTRDSAADFATWLTVGAPMPELADRTELAAMREQLAGFDRATKTLVWDRWQKAGLPKPDALTYKADLDTAIEVINAAVVEVESAPQDAQVAS